MLKSEWFEQTVYKLSTEDSKNKLNFKDGTICKQSCW